MLSNNMDLDSVAVEQWVVVDDEHVLVSKLNHAQADLERAQAELLRVRRENVQLKLNARQQLQQISALESMVSRLMLAPVDGSDSIKAVDQRSDVWAKKMKGTRRITRNHHLRSSRCLRQPRARGATTGRANK